MIRKKVTWTVLLKGKSAANHATILIWVADERYATSSTSFRLYIAKVDGEAWPTNHAVSESRSFDH